ncbi:MAG: hypothetical protein ACYC63_17710 [Armatimonadota bacterium]
MTYEPPTEGTPEEEDLQPQEAANTTEDPSDVFADEDLWDDEETPGEPETALQPEAALQPQEEAYLAGEPTYAPAPRKSSGMVSAVTVVLLALGLVAATVVGLKLHRDKMVAATAAGQLLGLVSEAAPAEMVKELSGIQADLAAGNVDSASGRIALLRTFIDKRKAAGPEQGAAGAIAGAAAEGPIPESAYKDLPADAARFFRANQDLFRRFLMLCTKSRELRDAGQNVDALRTVRDETIEAARLGQKPTVQQKMVQMLKMLGGKADAGGKPGKGGDNPLAAKAQQLREATNLARRQGRDIRPVFAMMQQAEQAAQSGDMTAAGKFLDKALVAARRAPKMSAADTRRMRLADRRTRAPKTANPLAPFVRALLGVMGQEEKDLRHVADNLASARGILFGQKPPAEQPDLLKPILDKAMSQLNTVADRRKQLQMQMQQAKRPNGKPLLPKAQARPRPGTPLDEEQRQGMLQIVSARVGLLLDRMRAMSEEEYKRDRKRLIRNVLQAVFAPPTAEEQAQLAASKPQKPLTTAQRTEAVRAKMLKASPALRTCEIAGKDTKPIEALFSQARKDLYAGKLDEAEKAVDEAMQLLGLQPTPPPASATTPPVDPIKIDLRARPR